MAEVDRVERAGADERCAGPADTVAPGEELAAVIVWVTLRVTPRRGPRRPVHQRQGIRRCGERATRKSRVPFGAPVTFARDTGGNVFGPGGRSPQPGRDGWQGRFNGRSGSSIATTAQGSAGSFAKCSVTGQQSGRRHFERYQTRMLRVHQRQADVMGFQLSEYLLILARHKPRVTPFASSIRPAITRGANAPKFPRPAERPGADPFGQSTRRSRTGCGRLVLRPGEEQHFPRRSLARSSAATGPTTVIAFRIDRRASPASRLVAYTPRRLRGKIAEQLGREHRVMRQHIRLIRQSCQRARSGKRAVHSPG